MKPRLVLCIGLITVAGGIARASSRVESAVRAADELVLKTDKEIDSYTKTSVDKCDEQACTRTVSYWDAQGKIRKVAEEVRTASGSGAVTGRYYVDCQLILARVTPNDTELVKNFRSVEKFYFLKGKLIRVTVGDEIQAFGKDQMAYYQWSQAVAPVQCTRDMR